LAVGSLDGSKERFSGRSEMIEAGDLSNAKEVLGNVLNGLQKEENGGPPVDPMVAVTQTRGSVPTDAVEATLIVGNLGKDAEVNMGKMFADAPGGLEERGNTDPTRVADAIIDAANANNPDITGAEGAKYYADTVKNAGNPALLEGSLPTYRAESAFITSGISGNYEKRLENDESVGLASNPHANPREVANMIIDSGVSHALDCTGAVGPGGLHSNGKPPCVVPEPFDNKLHDLLPPATNQAPSVK